MRSGQCPLLALSGHALLQCMSPLLTQSGHRPAFHVAVAKPVSAPIKALV
jgi:hypothetical protein